LGKQKHPTKSNLNWVLGGSPKLIPTLKLRYLRKASVSEGGKPGGNDIIIYSIFDTNK
jgi:hypothetical protein